MIDIKRFNLSKNDIEFLTNLKTQLSVSQIPVELKCGKNSFLVEPGNGGVEVWQFGGVIESFKTVDDFFLNFLIDGKPFIERISEIEYDD